MKLRQLEYFVAVVEEGSFTRAASRLHVAQPSLSQQIQTLETELGGALLERLPREICLTPAGKALLPDARTTLEACVRAERAARAALAAAEGELEIATVRSLAAGVLPLSIRRMHGLHPNVAIRLHEYVHRADLEQAMRNGTGDIAIGPRPRQWSGPVQSLGWERFVIIGASSDDNGASSDTAGVAPTVSLATLADRYWVLFESTHGLSDVVNAACSCAGFSPRAAVFTTQVEAACKLAAAGVGVTMVPVSGLQPEFAADARETEPLVVRELTAYTRSCWSSMALAYLDTLREHSWEAQPSDALVIA